MRSFPVTVAGLALTMLIMADNPAFAESSAAPKTVAKVAEQKLAVLSGSGQISAFLPADFNAPAMVETAGIKVVPLGPELVKVYFDAYMSSIEHLQKTFTRSTNWPHKTSPMLMHCGIWKPNGPDLRTASLLPMLC